MPERFHGSRRKVHGSLVAFPLILQLGHMLLRRVQAVVKGRADQEAIFGGFDDVPQVTRLGFEVVITQAPIFGDVIIDAHILPAHILRGSFRFPDNPGSSHFRFRNAVQSAIPFFPIVGNLEFVSD